MFYSWLLRCCEEKSLCPVCFDDPRSIEWLSPTHITQGDFCLLVHAAAQLPFWGNSCEDTKEKVECGQNVAWLL